jgi:hypothetical protein
MIILYNRQYPAIWIVSFLFLVDILNNNYLFSQDFSNQKLLLGKINNKQLELTLDDKEIIKAMNEESDGKCNIKKILIQVDDEGKYFLYGEGKKVNKQIIMRIYIEKNEYDELFVTSNSKIEYCFTANGCLNIRFEFDGGCDCDKKKPAQNTEYFFHQAFENKDSGFSKLFLKFGKLNSN